MDYPQNTSQIRDSNVRSVLTAIINNAPISKRELQSLTGFSWGAVSTLTNELKDAGYVILGELQDTNIGRKPSALDVNTADYYTIGVDLNVQGIYGILVDLKGNVIFSAKQTDFEKTYNGLILALFKIIDEIIDKKCCGKTLLGIGLAVQGIVLPKEGISVLIPQINDWHNVNLRSIISERYNINNVVLMHDPDCLMNAERHYGFDKVKNANSAILIRLDESIGFSFLADGHIYSGLAGRSGEFAHITAVENGARCLCGKKGCVEEYVSGGGMLRRATELIDSGYTTNIKKEDLLKDGYFALCNAAKAGDRLALKLFCDMGKYLAIALSSVINLLNPETVIFYGELSEFKAYFLSSFSKQLKEHLYSDTNAEILFSQLDRNAPEKGVSLAVIENAINNLTLENTLEI